MVDIINFQNNKPMMKNDNNGWSIKVLLFLDLLMKK